MEIYCNRSKNVPLRYHLQTSRHAAPATRARRAIIHLCSTHHGLTLSRCWPSVGNIGTVCWYQWSNRDLYPVDLILGHRLQFNAVTISSQHNVCPADTRRWINVVLTLVHRLRRWTNVKPTWIQRLVSVYEEYRWTERVLPLGWPSVRDIRPTLSQYWYNVWCRPYRLLLPHTYSGPTLTRRPAGRSATHNQSLWEWRTGPPPPTPPPPPVTESTPPLSPPQATVTVTVSHNWLSLSAACSKRGGRLTWITLWAGISAMPLWIRMLW